mgnify:CR=1 FL=1
MKKENLITTVKIQKVFKASLFVLMVLFMISCESEDDSNGDINSGGNGDIDQNNDVIGTWVLIKTVSSQGEIFENCSTSKQYKFMNDPNENDRKTFFSFEDQTCNGQFEIEFEGSYFYREGEETITINMRNSGSQQFILETLNENDLILYDGLKRFHFRNLDSVEDFGIIPTLVADFNILPLCCPPTTITGRHIEEVEIEFENTSQGDIVQYEWSFDSTEENPVKTFPLSMSFIENTKTYELTVTDSNGNTDSIEKSIDIPILAAQGTITLDGETCEINFYDYATNIPIFPPNYSSAMDMGEWISYAINDLSCSGLPTPVVHLGNFKPIQTFNMKQSGESYPSDPNEFYVSFGPYSTFNDDTGTISSGSVDLTGFPEGARVIRNLQIDGVVSSSYYGDSKNFSISIANIPYICYYPYEVLCDAQPPQ